MEITLNLNIIKEIKIDSDKIRKKFPEIDKLGITDYDLPFWLIKNQLDYLLKLDSDNITLDDYWGKISKN